ncbi:hypothetical protein C5167_002653 [Papaver somniferum]|uniref:Uncharacterized protein n=1 Tax=Papaver somniferum TaxID=3469 RepID=A0A4Y7L1B0_PAPSO|nr:hypothetical protein C5167_002653 [Papaver somniferum]
MSAPLRTMVPQIRCLGAKFISVRNFSAEGEGVKEVSENVYKKAGANIAKMAAGGVVGVTLATWLQYKAHGKATSRILGFTIGK